MHSVERRWFPPELFRSAVEPESDSARGKWTVVVTSRIVLAASCLLAGAQLVPARSASSRIQPPSPSFERNIGQDASSSEFLFRSPRAQVRLFRTAMEYRLPGNSTIRWQWIGASGQSPWEPRDSSGDTVSYFLSPDPRQWIRSLPTSRRILRRSLYPGVDWAVYASGDALEYDLILQPSADPASIRLRISAPKVSLTSGGSLVASTASGNIIQNPPVSYQVVRGKKKIVESRFVARDGGDFGLILGPRDPALPVFVDPSLHSVLAVEGSLDPRGGAVAAHPPHPRRQRRVNITHLNRTPSPPSGCGPGLSARTRPVPASTRT